MLLFCLFPLGRKLPEGRDAVVCLSHCYVLTAQMAILGVACGSLTLSLGIYRVKTIFVIILRGYLPFLLH